MKWFQSKWLIPIAVLSFANAYAQNANLQEYAEEEHQGVVRSVSVAENMLVVSGWGFAVPADVPVTIRGSHGALSMLATGMQVSVIYRMVDGERFALSIDQLPDNQEVPAF